MQQTQYEPNMYRNSKEAQEFKVYMKSQSKNTAAEARVAIFEELPKLFLQLDSEMQSNPLLNIAFSQQTYERMEALLLFKSENHKALQLSVNPELIRANFNGKSDENVQIAAQSNQQILEMHKLIEKYAELFKKVADPILFWFQVLLPKETSSGTTTGVEFLIQIIQDLQKAYEDVQGYYEKYTMYHNNRANIVKQIRKYGGWDFYQALMLADVKEVQQCREFFIEIYLNSISFYQGIGNNFEKLKANAKDTGVVAGGVIY
ncbi:Proteasome_activator pa28 beta subunit-containing protein [Hexamita inflata]|uniref:Proteasome activator pa28 beta subunit-containing protein n=1 Tax=Hexamita inflata TaxID=28002 RepID=A0AA86Q434_9EUKA|nr:Proteasome activator pa28 beta subunit-containing protein [Hexamita inflata]